MSAHYYHRVVIIGHGVVIIGRGVVIIGPVFSYIFPTFFDFWVRRSSNYYPRVVIIGRWGSNYRTGVVTRRHRVAMSGPQGSNGWTPLEPTLQ